MSEVADVMPASERGERSRSGDRREWPDAWLVAAVRREPPDEPALDALVERYWGVLVGRCRVLARDDEAARDLAQDAWYRVLRARRALDPARCFPAYLTTVATNLWRDAHRLARRAGPLSATRLASLDAPLESEPGEPLVLGQLVADLDALPVDDAAQLRLDVDRALERLTPRSRDVLVARFLDDESCAEIGRRYGRSEQTISGWVRQAIREVQTHLEGSRGRTA